MSNRRRPSSQRARMTRRHERPQPATAASAVQRWLREADHHGPGDAGPVGLDLMAKFVDGINSDITPCPHVELAANGDVGSVLGQDGGIAFWVAAHPTGVRCWACTLALGRPTVCDHCHSPGVLRDRPMALGPRLVMLARLCPGCSRGWRRQDGDAP